MSARRRAIALLASLAAGAAAVVLYAGASTAGQYSVAGHTVDGVTVTSYGQTVDGVTVTTDGHTVD